MTSTMSMITVDTTDALSLARWWAEQTDGNEFCVAERVEADVVIGAEAG